MSFNDAHAFAFSLAATLMAVIVIFRAGDGTLSVTPASEYDGDSSQIVREIDPDAFVILLPAHQVLGEGFRRAGDEL